MIIRAGVVLLFSTACPWTLAFAQTTAPAPGPQDATPPQIATGDLNSGPNATQSVIPQAGQREVSPADIIVTGSRIARRDYSSDSPIVTVSDARIKATGPGTLEGVLNSLPQFSAIRSGSSNTAARGGRNNANLRGLGITRTLTLLDGRRMQPSDLFGAVDLNIIPDAALSGVEVITGGASATYGSDAIAGVVNFKLNTGFNGLRLSGQYGLGYKGDADAIDVSGIAGSDFADGRGHVMVSASYLHRAFLPRGARPFFRDKLPSTLLMTGSIQADASNLPSQSALQQIFGSYGYGGAVPRNSTLGVNADGTLFTSSATGSVPILNLRYDDPPYFISEGTRVAGRAGEALPLQQGMEKFNILAHATYELDDWITAYGQFSFVHYSNDFRQNTAAIREVRLPVTNPFIPADLRAVLASRPNPNAPMTFWFSANRIEPNRRTLDFYDVYQGVVGFKGKIPGTSLSWDVYGSMGKSTDLRRATALPLRAELNALLNAPDGGRSVCPGGYDPFRAVPLGADPDTKACYDYVQRETVSVTTVRQSIVEGSLTGSVFKLPAGDLQFALGGSYRRNSFEDRPDSLLTQSLLVETTPGQYQYRKGSDDVAELFGELLVPVLRDFPGVRELNLSLAGRLSKYDSVGSVKTYKASAEWQVIEPVSFRGGYQRAIRVPALDQLYPTSGIANAQIGPTSQGGGDPCDVGSVYRRGASAAQVRSLCLASGVPESVIDSFVFNGNTVQTLTPPSSVLTQETSDSYTFGTVLKSPFGSPLLSNMQLSIDYYSIKLKGAIGSITAPITLGLCYNSNGQSNAGYAADNVFCQQIARDEGGRIIQVQTPQLNLAAYKVSGIDAQLDWTIALSGFGLDDKWGSLGVNTVVSYTKTYSIQTYSGAPTVNYAGTIGNGQIDAFSISHPKWKVQAALTWSTDDLSIMFQGRYISPMIDSLDAGAANPTRAGVPAKYYLDTSINYNINKSLSVRLGIQNLTNTQPPYLSTAPEATDVATYDVLGRRYSLAVTKSF